MMPSVEIEVARRSPLPSAERARVLVVDDDEGALGALRSVLEHAELDVVVAPDGATALVEAARVRPDVVLSDLEMPGLDGVALCQAVRDFDADLPFVVMTAHDDAASVLRALRAGVDDYLLKPLDVDLVVWCVRRAIGARAACLGREALRHHLEALVEEGHATVERYERTLSVVAHDLRGPLGIAQLAARELLTPAPPPADPTRLLEALLRATERMDAIVETLLEETRLRTGGVHLATKDERLEDVLADLRDLRPLALQRDVRLLVRDLTNGPTIRCDRGKLGQALANVVGNAIKYARRRGLVTVTAEGDEREVMLVVHDDGPGIPLEARPHLFDRFWRSAGTGPGLGLGLYIAKSVIEAHGGSIAIDGTPDDGATFVVRLPAASSPTT